MKIREDGPDTLTYSIKNPDGSLQTLYIENKVLTEKPLKTDPVEKHFQWSLSQPFHEKDLQKQKEAKEEALKQVQQSLPSIYKFWDSARNQQENITKENALKSKYVWWKHSVCNHSYKSPITSRAKAEPYCNLCFHLNNPSYAFLSTHWDQEHNGPLDTLPKFNVRFHWKCPTCGHESKKTITQKKANPDFCPTCKKTQQEKLRLQKKIEKEQKPANLIHSSHIEKKILFYLKTIFQNDVRAKLITNPYLKVTAHLPAFNIAITYESFYTHKGKEKADILKAEKLKTLGINLIRIRESRLGRLEENNILFDPQTSDMNALMKELMDALTTQTNIPLSKYLHSITSFLNQDLNTMELPEYLKTPMDKGESFALAYPEIARCWHQEFNTEFKLDEIHKDSSILSKTKLFWICPECNFEWREIADHIRSRGFICPKCELEKHEVYIK